MVAEGYAYAIRLAHVWLDIVISLPYKECTLTRNQVMPMPQTTATEIDIDVHRAIETRRTGFSQSHNDILREVFGLPKVTHEPPDPLSPDLLRSRRTGTYAFELLGERVEEGSLKSAYISCLQKFAKLDPRFLERLSEKSTRSRRIVAREANALYLKTPELSGKHAFRLTDQWWADTNLSRQQCEQRLKKACDVADLRFGGDLVLDFPN